MLIQLGWTKDNGYDFYVSKGKDINFTEFKTSSLSSIKESPFEYWVRSNGVSWINSLWKSLIGETRFDENWKMLKNLTTPDASIDPVQFLKKLRSLPLVRITQKIII